MNTRKKKITYNEKTRVFSFIQLHQKAIYWFCFAGVTTFCCWSVFHNLSTAPIFDWDEARHGVSAWEMIQNKDYLVQTYLGELDYWNLKPPLAFWPNVLGYKMFGVNPFGFRFISGLSLVLCCAGAMLIVKALFDKLSSLTVGILFAVLGVKFNHLFLHGDADAVFFLFCFLAVGCFTLAYLKDDRWLVGAGLSAAGAFLTKAAHAGILLIIFVVAFILLRRIKKFSAKSLSLFLILPMSIPVVAWAAARWNFDKLEFLYKMFFVDILSRTSSELEGNARGASYYFDELARVLGPMLLLFFMLVVATSILLIILQRKNMEDKNKVFMCNYSLMAVVPLLLYTFSTTKLSWYVWPSCIGFFMLTAWLLSYIVGKTTSTKGKNNKDTYIAVGVVTALVFLVGLLGASDRYFMQWNYDTSTVRPELNIFDSVAETAGLPPSYIVVNPTWEPSTIPQSWVLQGIFQGYYQEKADNQSGYKDILSDDVFLVVRYDNIEELTDFESANAEYELKGKNDSTAIFTVKNQLQ